MKKGTIRFITNDMSGLQTITFKDGTEVLMENFGIEEAFKNPLGKTILYEIDEHNVVTSFDFEPADLERMGKESMDKGQMDPKTKEEYLKILLDVKQHSWDTLTDEEKEKRYNQFHKEFYDIVCVILDKSVELVNDNNPRSVWALKELLKRLADGPKFIEHSLIEIAYRRAHNKY